MSSTSTSLYALTVSFNKYLLTSTFQALFKAPEVLKMKGRQLSFYLDYSVIRETDMQNISYNTVSCLHRGIYKTPRTWPMERSSAWRNQGNTMDKVATELPLTRDQELTTQTGRQRGQQVHRHQGPGELQRSEWCGFSRNEREQGRSRMRLLFMRS